ncbi:alpha-glucan family phosphorylase [Fimbriimonas ginsengisoli]|uniref:Alpha-glucan phosphorylase n=1 Tax=Fimbriimonas ginsengisoli Gsoil 348 TaxID=661478 RepID=A0A068NXE7_FIMGI|nr:alpha-glucan family phosphorylase [Fimbriimonas ginsengisoli]AIE88012.1 Alpha-glucan phosphorylase [Fimbriimonas ginsengisoli Gsoil 348]
MKHPKFSHAFEVTTEFPEALAPLKELASNYRWTWDHETRDLYRSIDKERWDNSDHNPILFLNSLGRERLERLAADGYFITRLNRAVSRLREYLGAETWFGKTYPELADNTKIAYFCAEFGISEGLPIYSGGLGVLAGDHLKAASDLGIPLVGVGLLYNRGYFRQRLNHDGWQQEVYPQYDFYQMPLTLIRGEDGQPLRIDVEFPDRTVTCQVWRAEVGRVSLFLMDSNVLENQAADQGITDNLYGGDEDMRIRQEMILGIGGMKALRAIGINPTVCHMNEGHAAFLSIERIRQFMQDHGCDFRTARQVIVGGNIFTTHTPVPAGFDLFNPPLLERYMGKSVAETGLPFEEFVKLGRVDPENQGEAFNMAVLAMENANRVNSVSKLHGEVTRGMFSSRWPGYPEDEVPVGAVTNGIHTMTWVSKRMAEMFDNYLDPAWRRNPENPDLWAGIDDIPDEELWGAIEHQRGDLIRFIRRRLQNDLERRMAGGLDFGTINGILDPRILTIGFARRFATYKRASLMLTDRDRLKSILYHSERPVQIVISGKSHPRDDGGKRIIQDLVQFMSSGGARTRMVFLEDYDMRVARQLVQGVDLWLNNPRRPHEASGTSGMKVVPNGGLNLSILDGWWDEGYEPGLGWAIGDRTQLGDEGHQDWLDSRALYHAIEHEVAPMFYHRVENGVPRGWVQMVKRSIQKLGPTFSTNRMVRDYARDYYVPAARTYHTMADGTLDKAREALAWRDRVRTNWGAVRVAEVRDGAETANPLGRSFEVTAAVEMGPLAPGDVSVQAVVGKVGPNRELQNAQITELLPVGADGNRQLFKGTITCDVPGYQGYTVRVVPKHDDVAIPSELSLIAWE